MTDNDGFGKFLMVGLPLAVALSFAGWYLAGDHSPSPQPAKSEAYGCYTTEDGRTVIIDHRGFRGFDLEVRTIAFDLRRSNSGLRLELESAPLSIMRSEKTKALYAEKQVSLQVQADLDTAPIVDGFWIAEAEGSDSFFRKTSADDCS